MQPWELNEKENRDVWIKQRYNTGNTDWIRFLKRENMEKGEK